MKKARQLRDMNMDELFQRGRELQEELFNLCFQHGTNQLENPMRMRLAKKEIARVKTIIREKERASSRVEG
ncbi:MAG: 50S ribosomal protein L29 [Pseudomonadota bacterium]